MSVTVLTASIGERAHMLAEAMASVRDQTMPVEAHLVGIDLRRRGAPVVLNRLLGAVDSEWLMVLDDDDLLDPHHLKTVLGNSDGADVVYSYCRCEGNRYDAYNQPFQSGLLHSRSIVAHTAMVRADAVRKVEGWRDGLGYDADLWRRLYDAGAVFRCVPEVTWTYRLLGGNQSWCGTASAP